MACGNMDDIFYVTGGKAIVSEIIDDEAIILDLRSGTYFSALGAGAVIWDGLVAGFSTAEVLLRLRSEFTAAPETMDAGMAAFVAALCEHGLLTTSAAPAGPRAWTLPLAPAPIAFVPPVLEIHGDLEDLARLDPIHDVEEERGWPNRKTDHAHG